MGQRPSFSHLTGYPEAVASAQDFAPYGHTEARRAPRVLLCLSLSVCELRAGLLSPRVVPPHPQGLQGSHLNLSQASAQRHTRYFLLNNKAVNPATYWACTFFLQTRGSQL